MFNSQVVVFLSICEISSNSRNFSSLHEARWIRLDNHGRIGEGLDVVEGADKEPTIREYTVFHD